MLPRWHDLSIMKNSNIPDPICNSLSHVVMKVMEIGLSWAIAKGEVD
jgi:hypothetical protein